MRENFTRRNVVQLAGVAAVGALAGCSSGSADSGDGETDPTTKSGDGGGTPSFDGWLSDTSNYDGVVDKTGSSAVTVEVGAQGNGGHYAFAPAAIKVSTGTTVTWKWVAGNHDVAAKDGSFNSKMTGEKGFTFSQTFDSTGTTKYYCTPHKAMGMKGVVVVE